MWMTAAELGCLGRPLRPTAATARSAPGWPGVKDPEETRRRPRRPSRALGDRQGSSTTTEQIIPGPGPAADSSSAHSFGGLFTQLFCSIAVSARPEWRSERRRRRGSSYLPASTPPCFDSGAEESVQHRNGLCPFDAQAVQMALHQHTLSQEESEPDLPGALHPRDEPGVLRGCASQARARNSPAAGRLLEPGARAPPPAHLRQRGPHQPARR